MKTDKTDGGGDKKISFAVIIPALNAETMIGECLKAIGDSHRLPDEIWVYDDGSSDNTGEISREYGARVIRNDGSPKGPGAGRNICAAESASDILIFVDADVIVDPPALGKLVDAINADAEIVASFGSYNDDPRSDRPTAVYANLRHHYIHQRSAREAATFWSGLGAIRRSVFLAVGGYDAAKFSEPSIEDVELGVRLKTAGYRIVLERDAQGVHLKDWTLEQLWRTDVLKRAIPWARLIASKELPGTTLNASWIERIRAVFAHFVWLSAGAALVANTSWLFGVAALVGYIVLNKDFFSLLIRKGGLKTLLWGVFLHWCYHLYASVTVACVLLLSRMGLGASTSATKKISI